MTDLLYYNKDNVLGVCGFFNLLFRTQITSLYVLLTLARLKRAKVSDILANMDKMNCGKSHKAVSDVIRRFDKQGIISKILVGRNMVYSIEDPVLLAFINGMLASYENAMKETKKYGEFKGE